LPQQRVHYGSGVQQFGAGGQRCGLSLLRTGRWLSRGVQISPCRRYQRACPVGQHQCQAQLAAPAAPAQHFECHALKGMALANDRYVFGKVVEVVGSLSGGLSEASHTPN
jgi:hypothetical protein